MCLPVFVQVCLYADAYPACVCLHEVVSLRGKQKESNEFNDIMLLNKLPPDVGRSRLPLTSPSPPPLYPRHLFLLPQGIYLLTTEQFLR